MRGKSILWLAFLFMVAVLVFALSSGSLLLAAESAAVDALSPAVSPAGSVDLPAEVLAAGQALQAGDESATLPGLDGSPPLNPEPPLPPLRVPAAPGQVSPLAKGGNAPSIAGSRLAASAGPDLGGYYYQDDASAGGPVYTWVEIAGSSTALNVADWHATGSFQGDDEGFAVISLPFAFPFYGSTYNSLYVDANGQVGFGPFSTPTFTGTMTIPSASYPNNRIDVFHSDLDLGMVGPTGGGVVWYWHDVANKRVIVEFKDAQRNNNLGAAGTFEIMLYENGDILVQYQAVSVTPSYLGGIENGDGSAGLAYGGTVAAGRAIGYYRAGVDVRVVPAAVAPLGGTSVVTATVRGRNWAPRAAPNGTTVSFSSALGSMGLGTVALAGGVAVDTFSAGGSCATGSIAATADLTGTLVTGYGRVTVGTGPTVRSGYVSGLEIWSPCNAPYLVQGSLVISPGARLDIGAGTLVQFDDDAGLVVLGELNALGAPGSPIYMTSSNSDPKPGAWRGVVFGDNANGATGAMDHVDVRFAGRVYGHAGDPQSAAVLLYSTASHVNITNSYVGSNLGAAVAVVHGSMAQVSNNVIAGNSIYGVRVSASAPAVVGNTISGSQHGIYLSGGMAATVSGNTLSGNQEGVHVEAAAGLVTNNTIANGGYGVLGNMSAANITLNSLSNNSAVGIFLDGGSTGLIDNNSVLGSSAGGLFVRSSSVTVTNNTLQNNSGFGAYLANADITFSGNQVTQNAPYGIYLSGGSPSLLSNAVTDNGSAGIYSDAAAPVIGSNSVWQNGTYGLFAAGGSGLVNASNTFWNNGLGGIYLVGAAPTIDGNLIQNNGSLGVSGYGILASAGSTAAIRNNLIASNAGAKDGYGVYLNAAPAQLSDNTIDGNFGPDGIGAGVYINVTNNARLTGGTASSNRSDQSPTTTGMGYGIYAITSTGSISGVVVSANGFGATAAGQGIHIRNSTFAITNVTASGNHNENIYIDPSNVTVTGSTVAGSVAGDGIVVWGGSTLTLTSSTVEANASSPAAAGIRVVSSTLRASNDVIQGNGIGVVLDPSTAYMTGVTLTQNGANGIRVTKSTLHLNGSLVEDTLPSPGHGVQAEMTSTVYITGSTITGNAGNGIDVASGSVLRGTAVAVTSNTGLGIAADPSQVYLVSPNVSGNLSGGIAVVDNSYLSVIGGSISDNDVCGITGVTSTLSISGVQIVRNIKRGIGGPLDYGGGVCAISSRTYVTASQAATNTLMGLYASGGTMWVRDSKIDANSFAGVEIEAGAAVTLTRNHIRYNGDYGVASGRDAVVSTSFLRSNSIYGNGTTGADDSSLGSMDARGDWWGINDPVWSGSPNDVAGTPNITPNITLRLAPSPATLPAGGTANIQALMNDGAGNTVIDGTSVGLTASVGSIGAPGSGTATRTTSGGAASATYYAGTIVGSAIITGTSADRGITWTTLTITAAAPYTVALTAMPSALNADGVSTSTITATVTDFYGNLINGKAITFTSNSLLGLESPLVTRILASGQAVITAAAKTVAGNGVVTGQVEAASGSTTIILNPGPPATVTVGAFPTVVAADGIASSSVSAVVRDAYGNLVSNGIPVNFASNLGLLTPATANTSGGVASSFLTSTVTGTASITATVGAYSASTSVLFTPGPPYSMTLVALPSTLSADGLSTAVVTATVFDRYGRFVLDGAAVQFTTDKGSFPSGSAAAGATVQGVATTTISSTVSGVATVNAQAGSAGASAPVTFRPGPPYSITLTAVPPAIPADGASTSQINASVVDLLGNPVADGTVVDLQASRGVLAPASQTQDDASGVAFGGAWTPFGNSAYYGGSMRWSNATGAAASWTFTGDSIALIYSPQFNAGIAEVGVDGAYSSTVDMYAAATLYQQQHTIATGLGPGTHTVVVRVTGTSSPLSSGVYVGVDGFRVGPVTAGGTAQAMLTSTTASATAVVTGTAGAYSSTTTVAFVPGAPASVVLQIAPTTIAADGVQTSVLTATVRDALNNFVSDGTPVTFTTSIGSIAGGQVKTTTGGVAVASLSSTAVGNAAVSAASGAFQDAGFVTILPGAAFSVAVAANPDRLTADGVSTAMITATVTDQFGNLVANGTMVNFAASLGTLTPPVLVPTIDGRAAVGITAPANVGLAYITATVGARAGYGNVAFDLRVNAGGPTYLSPVDGKLWAADQAYAAGSWGYDTAAHGSAYGVGNAIANTPDQPLYQTERYGVGNYKFTIPRGEYTVTLKFAELYYTRSGQRVFNVRIENALFLSNYDPFAAAGGAFIANDHSWTGTVLDGILNVDFYYVIGEVKISAIEVQPRLPAPVATPTATPTATPGSPTATPTVSNTPTATPTGPTATATSTGTTSNTPTATPTATSTTVAPAYSVRVNAGGGTYVDGLSNTWSADQQYALGSWGYVNGFNYTNAQPIEGTADDLLFQSERYWYGSGGYKFTVPNGTYSVLLRFAEIYPWAYQGSRIFSIQMEGATVRTNLDIYREVGTYRALDLTFGTIVVNDGVLDINFLSGVGAPQVNAIGINTVSAPPAGTPTNTPVTATPTATIPAGGASVYRVNAGGPAYVDVASNAWLADQPYASGSWGVVEGFEYVNPVTITNTTDPVLYQSERWWTGVGTYKFPVPNGSYNVVLRFAEIYPYSYPGSRIFDIRIEGSVVQSNFEIIARAGRYNAIDLQFLGINVSDGMLQIDFLPKVGSPKVNAIYILRP